VHRNDLVISTMGRSAWIMDNVTPLQQLAASSSLETAHLFQPRETIRYRHSTNAGDSGQPEYPAPGVHIDLWFKDAPPGDARLEILDAGGQVIRSFGVGAAPQPGQAEEMRATFRGGGGASSIRRAAGMQRFTWDMRHAGAWTAATPQGGSGGPMVAPGTYGVRLTAAGQTQTRSFELKVDPRVTQDGVTPADIEEQVTFLLRLRDTISDARRLQQDIEQAMKKVGVPSVGPAVPGSTPGQLTFAHPLQALWARVADQSGTYPQPMLISQLNNVNRMVGQADQKVGKDAYDRYTDLLKELQALQAEFKQIRGGTP
jgi:hypothetical protein